MKDRYLFKAKTCNGEWVIGFLHCKDDKWYISNKVGSPFAFEIRPDTICRCTGLKDKNGKLIWENDILMSQGNQKDISKVVYGKFAVINAETLETVDNVIGWHYKVIPTDALSKCVPFCLSMPLTDVYIETCEFEVIGNIFDNHELLESEE